MNLIDRYVAEVGRHLPEKSRDDIEKEIRSTLEDMLDDRGQKADIPVDDNMMVEVLKEFGHPRKVAASYMPERYLIGPQLYPYFLMVMKISLLVAVVVALINLGVGIIEAGPTINSAIESIVESVLKAAASAITVLGNVVLIFAIIERALPNIKEISLEWDPRSLPEKVTKSERVNIGSLIGETVFIIAAILIFNFYPQILGAGFFSQGKWIFFPVLSSVFFHYLPWLNIQWILELIQNAILLRQGRWQPATRWFSILVDMFGIGVLYLILRGPSILGLTSESLQTLGISNAATLVNLIGACVTLGLSVAIVVQTIMVIVKLYKLLIRDKHIPIPAV